MVVHGVLYGDGTASMAISLHLNCACAARLRRITFRTAVLLCLQGAVTALTAFLWSFYRVSVAFARRCHDVNSVHVKLSPRPVAFYEKVQK